MKIRHIICLAIGAFVLFLAIKGTVQINDSIKSLDDAVYLESPVVLPENEGKQIIIAGKVEMTKAAYDNELDIVLYTPVAERVYEVEKKDSEGEYSWSSTDRKYFYGEASLGEFKLDKSMLKLLRKLDGYWDFDEEDIDHYTTESRDGRFYILDGLHTRYHYSHCDLEKNGEMTLVGVQKGNSIVLGDATVAVNDGILSLNRLRQENKTTGAIGLILGYVIALGLIAYGLSSFIFKKK